MSSLPPFGDIGEQEEELFPPRLAADLCARLLNASDWIHGGDQQRSACNSHDGVSRTESTFPKRNFHGTHRQENISESQPIASSSETTKSRRFPTGKRNGIPHKTEKRLFLLLLAEPKIYFLSSSAPHNSSSALWTRDWSRWLIQYATSS